MNDFYESHKILDAQFPILHRFRLVDRRDTHRLLHWHENIEFWYIVGEEAIVNVGGEIFPAQNEDLIVVNSCQLHDLYTKNDNTRFFYLILDKVFCESLGFMIEEKNLLNKIHDPQISLLMKYIIEELKNQKKHYRETVLGYIRVLLSYAYRDFEVAPYYLNKTSGADIVKAAIDFIQHSYSFDITLEDISQAIQYNKFYMAKVFKQITGLSVISYLNHYRILRAKELLSQKNFTIEQIAENCGFTNQFYFTTVFKKHTGITPNKYRNQKKTMC